MFGSFLVSLPYLNSAGVILRGSPDDDSIAVRKTQGCLIDRAVELADALDVKHLELRGESRIEHPAFNRERTDKVHMRLQLPLSADLLMASFKSKLRSQVKKSGENPFEIRFGGSELLGNFYSVFSQNMRDLGTPVYSKGLFRCVVDSFGKSSDEARAEFCIVSLENQPVSVALLVHHQGITEVPSASTLRRWNSTGANMWMYWNLLQRAIEKGSKEFDFGRSSIDSGTYNFKEQWGAMPKQAVWQYYVRKGDPSDMRPDSPTKVRLVKIWKKLPLWLTRLVGPSIVKGIP
jgi:FemAB-related protein (PEP-CTERM system-associated)